MAEQLSLDFTDSAGERAKRARRQAGQLPMFATWSADLDVHLRSPAEAVAAISGPEPERAHRWLAALVPNARAEKARRAVFPAAALDRLAWVRPPARVTLDANAAAVAYALHAARLGLRPITVVREGARLRAHTPRGWPAPLRQADIAWPALAALATLGAPLAVHPGARALLNRRLAQAGAAIATASAAGTSVALRTTRPDLLEALGLPALRHAGEPGDGHYRMPLLLAGALLDQGVVHVPGQVRDAIERAAAPAPPLNLGEDFPWRLWDFQERDARRAKRILHTLGGVLLAGDMGSGKTTVALALCQDLDLWPLLVVCPVSAFSTWARQLGQMGRSHLLATGSPKAAWQAVAEAEHDAYVVSYDRLHALAEILRSKHPVAIVADEIQRVRNPGSRRSRALRAMASTVPYRLGLSGTPLVNVVGDLLAQGAFLVPGEWPPRATTRHLQDLYPGDPQEAVAEHLGAMMVRRRMDQVGRPMPARHDRRVHVQLTAEQRRALAELREEAEQAKAGGAFDGPDGKFNALVRLTRMRKIVANPASAGVGGPNPKIAAGLRLITGFRAQGRRGVVFCADRATYRELGDLLDRENIPWGGIWGSTPPLERIEVERRLHAHEIDVVIGTYAAAAESWSASPTATYFIGLSYVYAPATLEQAEARVYRLNSDLDGPDIEIVYVHASAPGGSIDDRVVEILEAKKDLFAKVVDRRARQDATRVHLSLSDLVYVLTGDRDARLAAAEADHRQAGERERAAREHARRTLHARTARNRQDPSLVADDGATALTREQWEDLDLEVMLEEADMEDTGTEDTGTEDTGAEDTGTEDSGAEDTGTADARGAEHGGAREDTGAEEAAA
ncbi:DEAD/DEAH box helicase [Bailinhaonella thermotolerans]|uniref:DEAD/DEAH box helicase n=1 Tax=Bailinhaonella thermotolerans TaxID=1070861 RepID=A0A3A4A7K7_9ACTN|nr:DEAD/DEAH box helicase [Bailinhaonella thermotolerans]RJL23991.1 DEAD/DEAH box helicase [Bailinhaonella thermotolerans]